MKVLGLLVLVFQLLSCAGGYRPPIQNPTTFLFEIAGTQESLFNKSVLVLTSLGYAIDSRNPTDGILTTSPREAQFLAEECDCGTYYQKPLTKDPASKIKIILSLSIKPGTIEFSTRFTGDHLSKTGRVDRRLECLSTGEYEKQLAGFIAGKRIN